MNDYRRLPVLVHSVSRLRRLLPVLLLVACATPPGNGDAVKDAAERPLDGLGTVIDLADPGEHEVVVVINNNAVLGNHAGLFAGARLSDPAGSYQNVRSQRPDWRQPGLADYVAYQMVDGPRIQIYRFTLPEPQFSAVVARLPEADRGMPLFCGAAVQNAIAGIGPFKDIAPIWWTSPADLARLLDSLTGAQHAAGSCLWPDGLPC
ncbi:MAG: hypothetical protein H6942_05215 [Candidatus Accumulibacter sp.]|uniref:hypothetical protein n=1 Tax=Accumulibacter sp. TaxID=2053492 RepID=UPI0025CB9563|nr:hypothetical protein [Accumulibacter sp.]MCP5247931.1 hypothetical protein [Accumulibacter sp.]